MSDKQAKDKRKGKPGRPPSHGGYSLIIRAGELPQRRTYLRAYLQKTYDDLTRDLGPREEDLTAAQRVLRERAVSKLAVIRCIEEHVKETGVFKGKELSPVLAKSYITYTNSLRLDLEALGIDKRAAAKVLDLTDYVQAADAAKDEKAKARSSKAKAIAPQRSPGEEIPGKTSSPEPENGGRPGGGNE
jgi:hypothetical protein